MKSNYSFLVGSPYILQKQVFIILSKTCHSCSKKIVILKKFNENISDGILRPLNFTIIPCHILSVLTDVAVMLLIDPNTKIFNGLNYLKGTRNSLKKWPLNLW